MKKFFSIFLCFLLTLSPYLYSQEEGEDDFLDKVNEEKPKKTLKQKSQKIQKGKIRKRRKKSQFKNKNSISPKNNLESKHSTEKNLPPSKSNEAGWVNEEMEIHPRNLSGQGDIPKDKEASVLKEKKIFEFSNENDKPKESVEKPIETKSFLDNTIGTFSDYKKILIIIGFIIAFAIYRIRAGKTKSSTPTRGSPRTISNFRKK